MKSVDRIQQWHEYLTSVNDSNSTQESAKTRRELILISKGQEYEKHKQFLKELHLKDQQLLSPFHPSIISTHTSTQKVEDRLLAHGLKSAERLDLQRKFLFENAESYTPQLPAREINYEYIERLNAYKEIYKKRNEKKMIEKIEAEDSGLLPAKVCEGSKRILEGTKRPKKVEERLWKAEREREERLKAERIKNANEVKAKAKPSISPKAQKIERTGEVSERLLGFQSKYALKLKLLSELYYGRKEKEKRRSSLSARNRLLKKKTQWSSSVSFSFKPGLGKKSLELAGKQGRSCERLKRVKTRLEFSFEEPECFFAPQINKKSIEIDNYSSEPGSRCERLYKIQGLINDKRAEMFEQYTELDPECTFKPQVLQIESNVIHRPFLERVNNWKQGLEEKLSDKKAESQANYMKECTFSPKIEPLHIKSTSPIITPVKPPELSYSSRLKARMQNK